TRYALEISEVIGMNEKNKEAIRFAGPLHDIGKIDARDDILLKPGKLTKEEYEEIKKHVVIGEEILRPLKFLHLESDIVRHHHENFDGTGYPDGLKGEAIPLLARIMSVADTYDALTSTKPYRKKRTHEEALNEIMVIYT
ncbi:MAG TPA: HD domain-containing phosphohydrolase, partial [Thermodesulfovibrionia bacterium]|nr:HD domain-containing phosphohydrolase [Thermodesulfovibrionia bacterium]